MASSITPTKGVVLTPTISVDTSGAANGGTDSNKIMSDLLAERLPPGSGTLCNDSNGLCLGHCGNIDASQSGIYTSLTKLARSLDGTSIGGSNSNCSNEDGEEVVSALPIVSIQTDKATILIKEYGGGRTVAFRIPNAAKAVTNNNNDNDIDGNQSQSNGDADDYGGNKMELP